MCINNYCNLEKLNFLLVALLASVSVMAQDKVDVPSFDTYECDFGTIDEAEGPVCHTFHLLNNSSKPVTISRAIPGCSCINADFSSSPILPGKIGDVNVYYSPAGAVGDTYRTIEIMDSDGRSLGTLSTKANVVPADRSIQERYFYNIADLLYTNKINVPFGYVYQGKMAQKVVYMANSSSKRIALKAEFQQKPELRVVCPETLDAGKESAITIFYSMPDDRNLYRTYADTIWIYVDGKKSRLPITTSAICIGTAEASDNAPNMQTYPSVGELSAGWFTSTLSGSIDISNKGKSDLVIYKVEAPQGVTVNIGDGTRIKPDGSISLTAKSESLKSFRINIFTNDPQRPFKELSFKINN